MKIQRKILSVLLVLILFFGVCPVAVPTTQADTAAVDTLHFASISDLHYYPQSLTGNKAADWQEFCRSYSKEYEESESIIKTALSTIAERAKTEKFSYLLVPGDLTKDSELEAHTEIAKILRAFEEETGIPVIVTNGNHDINTTSACSFKNDTKESCEAITPQGFYEVYGDLGFDLATSFYGIEDGMVQPVQNALSYTVQLDAYTQLIVLDSCNYSFGEPQKAITNGTVSEECLQWVTDKADEAAEKGMTTILMTHHNLAPHMKCEPSVTFAFVMDDYQTVAELFADHHIHFSYSGHLHVSDTAEVVNDNGEVLTDIQTCALTSYPNEYRESTYTVYGNGESEVYVEEHDFDEETAFVLNGKTYEQGAFRKESFGLCYGGSLGGKADNSASVVGFTKGLLNNYVSGIIKQINTDGGILEYLKKMNIDLQAIIGGFLQPYIGDGIKIGKKSILSVDNLMWFIEDLAGQIEELYINDPEGLWNALAPSVEKLADLKVSDYTVSDTVRLNTGIGEGHTYGTLEDVIFSAIYYFYTANEPDLANDALLMDFIAQCQNGIESTGLVDALLDIVFDDLINNAILSKLEVRLGKLFSDSTVGSLLADGVNSFVNGFLRGNKSYLNLVNTVFAMGVLPYDSLYDILDQLLLQKYWSDSQDEAIGKTLAWFLEDFASDSNPFPQGDYNATYSSARRDEFEVSSDNYRLPTMISVTMGADAQTSANIGWFSKYSLPETDIEIYKLNDNGEKTAFDGTITAENESVSRYYPGVDLGFIGIIHYEYKMNRHTVRLTNLQPGTKYTYRVGNAARDWWSDWGTVETADGSDSVTFLHTSDPQSLSEEQYTRGWANVLDTAFSMYPDTKFVACCGDLVDYGMNTHMWQWMFDTASDNLMNTYLMPTSGEHEEKDENTTVGNFVLSGIPEQDTTTGVYYSYTYNNVHIAVLNTNDLNEDDALSDTQVAWLRGDMTASDAQWKIVVMHKALYSNGSHYDDDDVCAMREQLGELMPELDIDLVLQGHDHVYLRTYALDNNKKVNGKITYLSYGQNGQAYKTFVQPEGTVYSVCGCAGVKVCKTKSVSVTDTVFPRADTTVDAYAPMFAAVQVRDGILYYDAYIVDGDEVITADSFAIQKNTDEGTAIPEADWPEDDDDECVLKFTVFNKIVEVFRKILTIFKNIFDIYVLGSLEDGKSFTICRQ